MSQRAIAAPSTLARRGTGSPARFAWQYLVGLAMMILGVLLSFAGLYSDIGTLYTRDRLWLHPRPYLDYPLEYPVGIGLVSWLDAALAPDKRAYILITVALLVVAGLALLWLGRQFAGANLWLLVLAPAFATYIALNWDMLAIAPTIGALLLLRRHRDGAAGVCLAVATWTKFFPIVLVPLVLIDRLARGRPREAARFGATFGLASVLINAPFAFQLTPDGPRLRDNWLYFFRFNQARPQEANLWALFAAWGATFDTAQINLASTALVAVGLAVVGGLLALVARRERAAAIDRLAFAALALLGWWFFINKVYSPQYSLWLIALLAILGAPTLLAATFALADLVWLGAILLAVAERTWSDWMHAPLLLPPLAFREAMILLVIGWALWRLVRPGTPVATTEAVAVPDPAGED